MPLPPSAHFFFDNSLPYSTDTFQVQVVDAVDPDGDPLTFQYDWHVNGQLMQSWTSTTTTATLDLSQPGCGDRLASAQAQYQQAWLAAEAEYSATVTHVDQQYSNPLTAADTAYVAAIEPAQLAREEAYAQYLNNPEDSNAQAAYAAAEARLAEAMLLATAAREQAYASALAVYQAGLTQAVEAFFLAEQAASSQHSAMVDPA